MTKQKDPVRELERTAARRDRDALDALNAYEIAHAAGDTTTRRLLDELRETARDRRAAHRAVSDARDARARAEAEAPAATDGELTLALPAGAEGSAS